MSLTHIPSGTRWLPGVPSTSTSRTRTKLQGLTSLAGGGRRGALFAFPVWKGATPTGPGNCCETETQIKSAGAGSRANEVYCICGDLWPWLRRMTHCCIFCRAENRVSVCAPAPTSVSPAAGGVGSPRTSQASLASAQGLCTSPPRTSGRSANGPQNTSAPHPPRESCRLRDPLLPCPRGLYGQPCCPSPLLNPTLLGPCFSFGGWGGAWDQDLSIC